MNSIPTPRFRGNALEVNEKWGWELLITFMGDGDEGISLGSNNLFDTKEQAIADLKSAIQHCTKEIAKFMGMEYDHGKYIDMNTNKIRSFDNKDIQ